MLTNTHSLARVQEVYGIIRNLKAIGQSAHRVLDQLMRLRCERHCQRQRDVLQGEGTDSNAMDSFGVIDTLLM